ncbi:calcium-binding protein [Donghicola sp. XS_ASV15]|uniref:calcium-binding protein n=1 Tax=Donghicola sp. XS_ASV15 TaxID=3241295 RepID=UPI00351802F7
MLFSLLASYGAYAAFIDDDTDSDSDDDSDEQVQAEAPEVETEADSSVGEDQTENVDPTEGEDTVAVSLDEYLVGTDAADEIRGGDGSDSLEGGKGGDLLLGGSGNDVVSGEEWQDTLNGGQGDDLVAGGRSEDLLYGAGGDDALYGDGQSDTLLGGGGSDTLWGGDGTDALIDNQGNNVLVGEQGDDMIIAAGSGDQAAAFEALADRTEIDVRTFLGWIGDTDTSGADEVYGDGGDDTLFIGSDDTATGGKGLDTFSVLREFLVDGDEPAVITDFKPGVDIIEYTVTSNARIDLSINYEDGYAELLDDGKVVMRLDGADESFTLDDVVVTGLFVPENGVETFGPDYERFGSVYDDLFMGRSEDDSFYAGQGDDTLYGEHGDDLLLGNAGDDFISGGAGDDTMDGNSGNDEVVGGTGDDTIFGDTGDDLLNGTSADLRYVRFDVGEDETIIDVPMDNDTISTEGFDLIKGGEGNDVLIAGGGDTIDGRDGADALILVETADSDDVIAIRAFDPYEDYLMIKYEGDTAPVITTELDADEQGTMIYLDGVAFAQINQPLPSDFNVAAAIGLEPIAG